MSSEKEELIERFKKINKDMIDVYDRIMLKHRFHDDDCKYKDSPDQCTCWIKKGLNEVRKAQEELKGEQDETN